jgi:hypothetical protein
MAKVIKRSVAPVYFIGLVFAAFALSGHLYAPVHYALAAVVSLAAFAVARVIFPNKVFEVPDPEPEPEPKTTGNAELDALIDERDKALGEMHRLNDSIKDEKISAQIDHLEGTTKKITDYVVANPQKLTQIRRFMNYYLPTTLKLLNAYDRMGAAGVEGANIDGTMGKIEKMMDTVVLAFDKQLDALFGDEALDISSDITVLENMLAREGLGGTQMNA